MKVGLAYTRDDACALYRLYLPGRLLHHQGHDVEVRADIQTIFAEDGEAIDVEPTHDVVVLSRPMSLNMLNVTKLLQARGVAVVVEIDDNARLIHPTHSAWKKFHPKYSPDYNWKILEEVAKIADWVTVTTPALAEEYGKHGRVSVLPNYVPEQYLSIRPEKDFVVGWGGAVSVHPQDLQVMGGALREITTEFNIPFRHIGTGDASKAVNVDEQYYDTLPWLSILEYPKEVAKFGIGLVPLHDNEFNRAKSWLKGIEYAALGVPFVASPTDPYKALHEKGAGLLVARPRQWESQLRKLLSSRELWLETREAGIEAAKELTYEKNAWKWMEAWEQALNHRRQFAARTDPVPVVPTREEYLRTQRA